MKKLGGFRQLGQKVLSSLVVLGMALQSAAPVYASGPAYSPVQKFEEVDSSSSSLDSSVPSESSEQSSSETEGDHMDSHDPNEEDFPHVEPETPEESLEEASSEEHPIEEIPSEEPSSEEHSIESIEETEEMGSDHAKDIIPLENLVDLNPKYTIQHYLYFNEVNRETRNDSEINDRTALPIINTNPKVGNQTVISGTPTLDPYSYLMGTVTPENSKVGKYWSTDGIAASNDSGGFPTNEFNWKSQWMVRLTQGNNSDKKGELETVKELVPMFSDEKNVDFLVKPGIEYMSLLYNSLENGGYNTHYDLSEVWIWQPNDETLGEQSKAKFYVIDVPTDSATNKHNPSTVHFTNNPEIDNFGQEVSLPVKTINSESLTVKEVDSSVPCSSVRKYGTESNPEYLVRIQGDTIVRLVYSVDEEKNVHRKEANFFDYDITDGNLYTVNADGTLQIVPNRTKESEEQELSKGNTVAGKTADPDDPNKFSKGFGINSASNYSDKTNVPLSFGQGNTGTGLGSKKWENPRGYFNTLNQFNREEHNKTGLGLTFDLTDGLKSELDNQGHLKDSTLLFSQGIAAPDLFSTNDPSKTDNPAYIESQTVEGKTIFKKGGSGQNGSEYFTLNFNQAGSTYTLNQVLRTSNGEEKVVVDRLSQFSPTGWQVNTSDSSKSRYLVVTNGKGTDQLGDHGDQKLGFWPMDAASTWGAPGHDLKFGVTETPGKRKNEVGWKKIQYSGVDSNGKALPLTPFPSGDDGYNHNSYFGMSYTTDFVLQPGYCAPLRYFFFGDDDMFVYLTDITDAYAFDAESKKDVLKADANQLISADLNNKDKTKKISGVGGVHSSAGMYTDLWNFLTPVPYSTGEPQKNTDGTFTAKSKHYRLSVFFTERGESGSTCYMRYTLPVEPLPIDKPVYTGKLKVEKRVLSSSESPDQEYKFRIRLLDYKGTELPNLYSYKKYKNGDNNPIETGQIHSYWTTTSKFSSFKDEGSNILKGEVSLKDNEYILIEGLAEGTRYAVQETDANRMTTYAAGTIDKGLNSAQSPVDSNQEVTGSVDSKALNVTDHKDQNYLSFINVENPGRLTIQKHLFTKEGQTVNEIPEFVFHITLKDKNNNPLTKVGLNRREQSKAEQALENFDPEGSHFIEYLIAGEVLEIQEITRNVVLEATHQPNMDSTRYEDLELNTDGSADIKIRAEEAVTLINLPKGTKFEVSEADKQGYRFDYILPQSPEALGVDGNKVFGTISESDSSVPQVTLTYVNEILPALAIRKSQIIVPESSQPSQSEFENSQTEMLTLKKDEILRYYIEVKNISPITQTGVQIFEKIPVNAIVGAAAQNYIPGTAKFVKPTQGTGTGVSVSSDRITWTLNELAPGDSAVVCFDVRVPEVIAHTIWKNIAKANSNEKPDEIPSNPVESEEYPQDLGIEKSQLVAASEPASGEEAKPAEPSLEQATDATTKDRLEVKAGDTVRYYLKVTNFKDTAQTDVRIKDSIPVKVSYGDSAADQEYVEGSAKVVNPDKGDAKAENGVIVWAISKLEPHESVYVCFDVKVPSVSTLTRWKNQGSVSSAEHPEEISSNVVESEEPVDRLGIEKLQSLVTSDQDPTLDDAKTAQKDLLSVKAGERIRYYLKVTNYETTEQTGVEIRDVVPVEPVEGDLSARQRYVPNSAKFINYSWEESAESGRENPKGPDAGGEILWTISSLAPGDTVYVCFDVEIPSVSKNTRWKNQATVLSDNHPKIPSNPVESEEIDENVGIEKFQILPAEGSDPTLDEASKAQKDLISVNAPTVLRYYLKVTNYDKSKTQENLQVLESIPVQAIYGDLLASQEYVEGSAAFVSVPDASAPTVSEDGTQIVWNLPALEPDSSIYLSFDVRIPQVSSLTRWKNTALLIVPDPENPEKPKEIPSNPVISEETVQSLEIEKFQISNSNEDPSLKEALSAEKDLLIVNGNDTIRYYLKVTNYESSPQTGVIIRDSIPVEAVYGDNSAVQSYIKDSAKFITRKADGNPLDGEKIEVSDDEIVWSFDTLAPGQSVWVSFDVEIPEVSQETRWRNTASVVSVENPEEIPSNPVESEENPEHLQIEKFQIVPADPDLESNVEEAEKAGKELLSVQGNSTLRYYLKVTNPGRTTLKDVEIQDVIPVSPIFGDPDAIQTYREDSARFVSSVVNGTVEVKETEILWKIPELKAGAVVWVSFDVNVPSVSQTTRWKNAASVSTPEVPKIPSNPVVNEEADQDLEIEKFQIRNSVEDPTLEEAQKAGQDLISVNAHDTIRYYLKVTNPKDTPQTDVEIRDAVPVRAVFGDLEADQVYIRESARFVTQGLEEARVDDSGSEIIWRFKTLAPGQSIYVSFDVTVPRVDQATQWKNQATVVSSENPEKIPSNPVVSQEVIQHLGIEKFQTANPEGEPSVAEALTAKKEMLSVETGDTIRYYLKVTNFENTDQTNVVIRDAIPVKVIFGDTSATQSYVEDSAQFVPSDLEGTSIEVKGGEIYWKLDVLEAGQTIYVSFDVTVPEVKRSTQWRNQATVVSSENPEKIPSNPVYSQEVTGSITLEKTQLRNPSGSASQNEASQAVRQRLAVRAGDRIRYYLKAVNTGSVPQTNVVLSDAIPVEAESGDTSAVQTYIEKSAAAVLPAAERVKIRETGRRISWTIETLEPGETFLVSFDVTVPQISENTVWKNQGAVVSDQNPNETPSNPVESEEIRDVLESNRPQTPGGTTTTPNSPSGTGNRPGTDSQPSSESKPENSAVQNSSSESSASSAHAAPNRASTAVDTSLLLWVLAAAAALIGWFVLRRKSQKSV